MEPIDKIIQLYVGYLGRAPDPEGLAHYKAKLDAGETIEQFAAEFANSVEAKDKYPYLRLSEIGLAPDSYLTGFVNLIYQNLFGRDAEEEGSNFWKARLESGESTVAAFVMDIANGAQDNDTANDKTALAKKVAAAKYFTTQVVTEGIQWNGQIKEASVGIIANVDASSTADGEGGWEAEIREVIDPPPPPPEAVKVDLTEGRDKLSGTAADGDQFYAELFTNRRESTLNPGDEIDGGDGDMDELNVLVSGEVRAPRVELTGIEIVNIDYENDASKIIDLSASRFGEIKQLWQTDGMAQDVAISQGVTAGFRDTQFSADGVEVSAASGGDVTSLQVALEAVKRTDTNSVYITLDGSAVTTATIGGSFAGYNPYVREIDLNTETDSEGPEPVKIREEDVAIAIGLAGVSKLKTLDVGGLEGDTETGEYLVVNLLGVDDNLEMIDASEATVNLLFTTFEGNFGDGLATAVQFAEDSTSAREEGDPVASGDRGSDNDNNDAYPTVIVPSDKADNEPALKFLGGAGDDYFEASGARVVNLEGNAGNDILTGGSGADTISGGAGNDTISGGAGNDTITGGAGKDMLTGGAGDDTFVFAMGDSPYKVSERDTITDFEAGDKIKMHVAAKMYSEGEGNYLNRSFDASDTLSDFNSEVDEKELTYLLVQTEAGSDTARTLYIDFDGDGRIDDAIGITLASGTTFAAENIIADSA